MDEKKNVMIKLIVEMVIKKFVRVVLRVDEIKRSVIVIIFVSVNKEVKVICI